MQHQDASLAEVQPVDLNAMRRLQAPSAADVLKRIRSGEITWVIAGGCDTNGMFRAKRAPARRFARDGVAEVNFGDYMWAMDLGEYPQPMPEGYRHWWPKWENGFGDVVAVSDPASLRVVPWLERTAVVLCNWTRGHRRDEIAMAPRNVLRRVLERYQALGLVPRLAAEYEFHVLKETEESAMAKRYRDLTYLFQRPACYSALQSTLDDHVIGRLCEALSGMRLDIDTWGPEGSPGQYEINIDHQAALDAADQGFLFKHSIKELCGLEGMLASFMPTLGGDFGSGLHVHQSLWNADGESVFYDGSAPDGMSTTMRRYVAGQLAVHREFACLYLPTPTAYKRSRPYSAGGTTQTWSYDNKTVSVRVLTEDAASCRLEHRVPGAEANVYYAFAGMLASGLSGIEKELELQPPTRGDAYATSATVLPSSLQEAVELFEGSAVAREYLGDEFVDYYAATRRWELEQMAAAVTDWEFERYLVRG